MADASNSDERVGWELIWRQGPEFAHRYQTIAEPNSTVVEWADSVPLGGFILDVGCGVGRHVIYLGERGFRVAGVDISPSGIQITREACAARQIDFEGYVSDMNTLPWPDAAFDAALSTSTIHHHLRAGIVQSLDEVYRVLKPGGLILVDFPCTDTLDYQVLRTQVAAGEITEVEPNTFVDERPDLPEFSDDFLPHHYCDEADLRDLLRSFEIVRLWADLHEKVSEHGTGMRGKWVAFARKPLLD